MISGRKTLVVTGGIGSGKSEVCNCLGLMGFPVYDCDRKAKEMYSPEISRRIEAALGVSMRGADGNIDFSKLSGAVFGDKDKLSELEAVIHPMVYEDYVSWRDSLPQGSLAVMESAIFPLKTLFHPLADYVLEVVSPFETRVGRVMKRSSLTRAQVISRIEAQRFPDGFVPDYIIYNDGDLNDLCIKTEKIIKLIQHEN